MVYTEDRHKVIHLSPLGLSAQNLAVKYASVKRCKSRDELWVHFYYLGIIRWKGKEGVKRDNIIHGLE